MAVYAWEGRVRGGKTQKGEMEAPSKSAVIARLRQMQIQPIPDRIKERGKLKLGFGFLSGGVSTKELVVFTRQLSTMIDAGLPLIQSLDILAAQQKANFKSVLTQVKETVESGSTFADAIAKHPKVFDHLFVNLVRAGEAGGVLDTVLQRLAVYLEKIENIKRRIKGAMVYPAVVITVAIIVLSIILIFVVPTFASLFKDLGTTLPALTQFVVDVSAFLRN